NYPTDNPIVSPIESPKDKYGDIHNKEYLQWFCNKLDEYKYYIIISSFLIIGGGIIYLYWDSILGCWRSRQDDPDSPGPLPNYSPQIPIGRPRSLPSVSSESSNS